MVVSAAGMRPHKMPLQQVRDATATCHHKNSLMASLFTMSKLDERSVLADRYVPAELRRINTANITTPLAAATLPSLKPEVLLPTLVPPIPTCYCAEKHSNGPPVRTIAPELRFALHPVITSKKEPALPAVNGIGDLDSYCSTFETLLWEERQRILHIYEHYSQYNVPIHIAQTDRNTLTARMGIGGIADARPQLQTGDHVLFRPMRYLSLPVYQPKMPPHWSSARHSIEIDAQVILTQRMDLKAKRQKDVVVSTWLDPLSNQTLQQSYPIQRYNVRFVPSTKLYERCLSALDWLKTSPPNLAMGLLFPNQAPSLAKHSTRGNYGDLNDKQTMFVDMVRLRTSRPSTNAIRPPMLLTGPAGTGKTKTLLKTIFEILHDDSLSKRHCILVCTPSHSAADVVTTRLGTMMQNPTESILRLYDSDRPVETVPVHMLQYCRQTGMTGTFALPPAKGLFAFQVIVCTCSDAHLLYRAGLTNAQLRLRRRCFKTYMERALQECNLTGGAIDGVNEPHFTHLFIDEAAQATEPETLIPLSVVVDPLPGNPKVEIVLVGDPRQLSPNVYCTKAADCGLGKSFLERLLQRPVSCLGGGHPHMLGPPTLGNLHSMEDWIQYSFQKEGQDYLSVFLNMNYRGHASFLMMPSTLFYFDKLQSAKTNGIGSLWINKLRFVESLSKPVTLENVVLPPMFEPRRQSSWPVHFRGVAGQDTSVALDSFVGAIDSWSNEAEAKVVVEIVMTLSRAGVSTQSIGVMAPFRAQVVLIRKLLREKSFGGVNVGTIEDYQAVERDVIVLSLTRSNSKFVASDVERRMGVFQQPKRTNVATTRAENLFIVVGNPVVMSRDPIWRQWLWFFLRNALWYGEDGGKDILDWFSPSCKPCHCVRHRPGIDSAQFMFFTMPREQEDEDDIVTISTLERSCAPRPLA